MISYFARHPTAANLLMLVLLAVGFLSLHNLRRETFPDFAPGEVRVTVLYPGATAEDVEEVICSRVEDALDGVRFIAELRSESREGLGVITAEMVDGADLRTFKDEIETEVKAIDDFPEDVEDSIIEELHTTDPVLSLLVSGPMTTPDLKAYCEDLKTRLQTQTTAGLVTIQGFSDHQFRIELSQEALMRHGLSVADVADIVTRQSVDLPAGTIETSEREILVRFVDQRKSVQEIEQLVVVGGRAGGELRIRDLGRVVDLFELEEDQVILGNQRAGLLRVEKTKDQDILRVAQAVQDFIDDERARHPQLDIRVTQDRSILVTDRLNMLVNNGWQGMVLVFAVMWIFFNAKLSFWVVMSLPVSFLGACFFVPHLDLTINMLTMVALLLALGLLMDDGIVIAENIASHAARGTSAQLAVTQGVAEVGQGVISSFVTTICVLGPLVALQGNIGKILKVVPIMLILVLAVSLIEAFLILPAHLRHALHTRESRPDNRFRRFGDRAVDWLRERIVGRSIDVLLRWRYLWVGFVVLVFFLSIGLLAGGVLKFQALPELEGDVVVARVLLPPGTPLDRTEATVRKLTDGLAAVNEAFRSRQPGRRDLVETAYARFNVNDDAYETGPHVATVFADLLTAEQRDARIDDVVATWRSAVGQLPDVQALNYTEPMLAPTGRNIEIRLHGDNLHSLREAALQTRSWMAQFNGVSNLTVDLRPGKPELRIRLREGALGLGLDARTIARQLRGAYQGLTADEIQVGPESYEIDVTFAEAERDSLADLSYFHCGLPSGRQVPLSAVTWMEPGVGWSRIARVNGRRTVTLRGDVDALKTNTARIMDELQSAFLPRLAEQFPEVGVSIEGESKEGEITQASMKRGMLVGVIGIFVLLSFQFRSYVEPLVVMAAIPFSLIGVIWGHLLMGMDISMPSLLGFVSLSGIVVNDSILLVMFLKMHQREGVSIEKSAARASRERFRAIMLTSLTTIAGLLPLLSEQSLQAQVLIPLAISIVFGLLASTVLVLLVVPCLYTIVSDIRTAIETPRGRAPE